VELSTDAHCSEQGRAGRAEERKLVYGYEGSRGVGSFGGRGGGEGGEVYGCSVLLAGGEQCAGKALVLSRNERWSN
jgi:hypothetical protein